jgi:hypothetical protein
LLVDLRPLIEEFRGLAKAVTDQGACSHRKRRPGWAGEDRPTKRSERPLAEMGLSEVLR